MDSLGRRVPKFMKILTSEECRLNELVRNFLSNDFVVYENPIFCVACVIIMLYVQEVPRVYCRLYANVLPNTFRLKVRTGYQFSVDFDKDRQKIGGMSLFYKHFDLKGGKSLVFEYCGGYNFKVSILGEDFAEIEYPNIVHHFQTCRPLPGSIYDFTILLNVVFCVSNFWLFYYISRASF